MQFLARQPIFDKNMRVFGYELLFRRDLHDLSANVIDGDKISRQMVDTTLLVGLDTLCDGGRAFINCTRDTLTSGVLELLPPQFVVAEVLENIAPDEEIVAACRYLKEKGFLIALDDVVSLDDHNPLCELAKIIKVDFRQSTPQQRAELARQYSSLHISLLAEKVENYEEQMEAQNLGFEYFQGYFFQKPHVLQAHEISAAQLGYLQLLSAVQEPELDLERVEELIKAEPGLSYRLLRYMNSPLFFFTVPIASVRHAVLLLGQEQFRKWVSIVALVTMGDDKPQGTVVWALVRARFCELAGTSVRGGQQGMFLLGLLSSLPALLNLPIDAILPRLPIAPEIKGALMGKENLHSQVYRLVLAYEAGDWDACSELGKELGLSEEKISESYMEAVKWAHLVTHSESGAEGQAQE